jgi:hypothetical protein
VEDRSSHDLHDVVFVPSRSLIELDVVSTVGEHSAKSRDRLMAHLRERLPSHEVRIARSSYMRSDRHIMTLCRAQVSLRDILKSDDFDRLEVALERLRTVAAVMEREARVAAGTAGTLTAPLLATAALGVATLVALLRPQLGGGKVRGTQSLVAGATGAAILYSGWQALDLRKSANRVWKRAAEYNLILSERKHLRDGASLIEGSVGDTVPSGVIVTDREQV